jgi:prepilin-type N-terminal cleavage/methylation domain-containing protein
MKKAFTLLEMLVVFALMGILFGLMVLYTQVTQVRADLNAQVDVFVAYARLTQSNAASGKDDTDQGLHLETDSYTLFSGAAYNPVDSANTLIELPPTVEIQNITLNGGGGDLLFSPPRGESSTYGTLDFVSLSTGQVVTLTISAHGTLEY